MDVKSAAPCPPGYTWVTRHLRKLRGKGAKLERIAKPGKTKQEKTAAQRARKAAKLQAIKEDEERLKQLAREYARKGEEWKRKAEKQAAEIRIAEQNRPLVLPKDFKSHRQIHKRPRHDFYRVLDTRDQL